MNDRYLFKAKRKNWEELPKEEQWVEGGLLKSVYNDRAYIIQQCKMTETFDDSMGGFDALGYEVDSSTICQCTGLEDKNRNLIWENDVIRFQFDNDDCPFPNKDVKKRIGKVFFSDFRASWSIAMGRKGSKSLNNDLFKYVKSGNRVEVIGNIFDNHELLEVK